MYYNARFYDPSIGRFLTPDTIVPDVTDAQAFNRYAYVLNNPIKYTDPTGHYPQPDAGDTQKEKDESNEGAKRDYASDDSRQERDRDKHNYEKLKEVKPKLRKKIIEVLRRLRWKGFEPRIHEATRSILVQAQKYINGTSNVFATGKHLDLDGTGSEAVDIIDERYGWDDSIQDNLNYFEAQGEAAETEGLEWGGNWTDPWDPAHIELP